MSVNHVLDVTSNVCVDVTYAVYVIQADTRFVWNGHLLRELSQQPELSHYCIPIMLGCILTPENVNMFLTFVLSDCLNMPAVRIPKTSFNMAQMCPSQSYKLK